MLLFQRLNRNRLLKVYLKSTAICHPTVEFSQQPALLRDDFEEVKIPVPWGHIAGKYWGSHDKTTFLLIHGWLDNAGSFDSLIPLLPADYSYLAIDLPGHGFSSHYPPGSLYTRYDAIASLRRVQNHFGWSKMRLLGHSLGGVLSFMYTAFFPDQVETLISIDSLKPLSNDMSKAHSKAVSLINKILEYESYKPEDSKEYAEKDLIALLQKTLETNDEGLCKILMNRGAVRGKNGLYILTRDPRIKGTLPFGYTHSDNIQLVERVKCNVLVIKSKDTTFYEAPDKFYDIIERLKKTAKHFEYVETHGIHHLHMEKPDVIATILQKFLTDAEKKT